MNLPIITIEQLLEAGIHFGHNTKRWNPKMKQYIFGIRNKIHIIDLRITLPLINNALTKLFDVVSPSDLQSLVAAVSPEFPLSPIGR